MILCVCVYCMSDYICPLFKFISWLWWHSTLFSHYEKVLHDLISCNCWLHLPFLSPQLPCSMRTFYLGSLLCCFWILEGFSPTYPSGPLSSSSSRLSSCLLFRNIFHGHSWKLQLVNLRNLSFISSCHILYIFFLYNIDHKILWHIYLYLCLCYYHVEVMKAVLFFFLLFHCWIPTLWEESEVST